MTTIAMLMFDLFIYFRITPFKEMASNFSANQFEDSFKPRSLCNWEVPHWYPARPHRRTTTTKFIANDRGHLLPDVERPKSSPWGRFQNTWQMPKRITKAQANELNAPQVGSSRWAQPDPNRRNTQDLQVQVKVEELDKIKHGEEIVQVQAEEQITFEEVKQDVKKREFSAKESLNNPIAIAQQGRRSIRHETLERDNDEH